MTAEQKVHIQIKSLCNSMQCSVATKMYISSCTRLNYYPILLIFSVHNNKSELYSSIPLPLRMSNVSSFLSDEQGLRKYKCRGHRHTTHTYSVSPASLLWIYVGIFHIKQPFIQMAISAMKCYLFLCLYMNSV